MLRKSIMWLACIGLAFFTLACSPSAEMVTLTGKTMGTTYHIKYLTQANTPSSDDIHEAIRRILKQVNQQMSTYQADSELSRFNQSQQINHPIAISQDLTTVIAESLRLNKLTEGALDITVGPLVNLWGFGPTPQHNAKPSEQQIAQAYALVGIQNLVLDQSQKPATLSKKIEQLYVDLSAIAKGFGVDVVAHYLDSLGLQHYLVEIGGELRGKGHNMNNESWQIAIESPNLDKGRVAQQIISLSNLSMATSGDYRNYFEQDGLRYSHEIDPKTGYPIQHKLASITVLNESCMTADGLSTGLFVLGEDKALEIAEKENLAVYLIIKTEQGFETKMSSAFRQLIQ